MRSAIDPQRKPAEALSGKMYEQFCPFLGRPVISAMIEVVGALLLFAGSTRGWYGRLTLWGIARCMATRGKIRSRYKRLDRLLCNGRFVLSQAIQGLIVFSGAKQATGLLPVLLDQTSLNQDQVQAIVASFPWGNRGVPFAMTAFEIEKLAQSQNDIEWSFMERILRWFGQSVAICLVMDRGYAKLIHLKKLLEQDAFFIVRGRGDVTVEYSGRDGHRRIGLGRLPHRQGIALRYHNVLYHASQSIRVDIVVYHGKGFQEPWFLIVPPQSEGILSNDQVVEYYRFRMRIEVTFRDFKSCLGLRGLRLKVNRAEKMERILICLALAYIVMITMGETQEGRFIRKRIEVRRKKPRHGTRRTLSVLSIALFVMGELFTTLFQNAVALIADLMNNWSAGVFSPCLVTT